VWSVEALTHPKSGIYEGKKRQLMTWLIYPCRIVVVSSKQGTDTKNIATRRVNQRHQCGRVVVQSSIP